MKPVIIKEGDYRICCLPSSKARMQAFVVCRYGRAKIWLQPNIEVCEDFATRLSSERLQEVLEIAAKYKKEFISAWLS